MNNEQQPWRQSLESALDRARAEGKTLSVTFYFEKDGKSPSPSETKRLAQRIIKQSVQASGHSPVRDQVMPELGAMTIHADSDLMSAVSSQPSISNAQVHRTGFDLIEPVTKSDDISKGWAKPEK